MNASTIAAPGDNMGQSDQTDAGSAEPPEPPEPTNRGNQAAAALTLQNESSLSVDEVWLRRQLLAAIAFLARPVQRVDVALLGDDAMTALHVQYHNIAATTDVLTFDVSASADLPLEVDIAVGVDVAQRQATERGHRIERELLLYIVHGLLHCMGYDDHDITGYAAMHNEEDRILAAIGVGRTFTPGGSPTDGADDVSPLNKDHSG